MLIVFLVRERRDSANVTVQTFHLLYILSGYTHFTLSGVLPWKAPGLNLLEEGRGKPSHSSIILHIKRDWRAETTSERLSENTLTFRSLTSSGDEQHIDLQEQIFSVINVMCNRINHLCSFISQCLSDEVDQRESFSKSDHHIQYMTINLILIHSLIQTDVLT